LPIWLALDGALHAGRNETIAGHEIYKALTTVAYTPWRHDTESVLGMIWSRNYRSIVLLPAIMVGLSKVIDRYY
jgi:hypothetical protein